MILPVYTTFHWFFDALFNRTAKSYYFSNLNQVSMADFRVFSNKNWCDIPTNAILCLVFIFSIGISQKLSAQTDSVSTLSAGPAWLVPASELNKKRLRLLTTTVVVGYSATLLGLNYLWYADYPRSSFHLINDIEEWQQIDKAGHTVGPYIEAAYIMHVMRWTGIEHKRAAIYAGLTAFMLQNTIEVFDGFSAEWGASLSDVAANFVGSAIMTSQELVWGEQRIRLKILPHFETYPPGELKQRADQLYGTSLIVKTLKDYNSMNTWASINPASFFKTQQHLRWLNVAIGYGAGGMYGGFGNTWYDEAGIFHDRTDVQRYRKVFLSLDMDFSKIKTHSRTLKAILGVLNIVKVPAPTLEFNTKGQIIFHPLM